MGIKVKYKISGLIVLLFLSASFSSYSQQTSSNNDVNKTFNDAVNSFSKNDYDHALDLFNKVISDYSYNSQTTAAIVFKGRFYYLLTDYPKQKIQ